MDFLKEILGEELFDQLKVKIDAFNGDEANKGNIIKLANLGAGKYVDKGKYDTLNEQLTGKITELGTANNLIAELKKGTKGNEELQGKIAAYEVQVEQLQEELKEIKIKSALKVALLSEKAVDVDYLVFKLNEKLKEEGKTLELDENDNIEGWYDELSRLKAQFPTMFESSESGNKKIVEKKLDKSDADKTVTKEQFKDMSYEERVSLKQENEQLYRQLSKN